MQYLLPAADIATAAVADTFKTIAALRIPDTTGLRGKLMRLLVSFADDAAADQMVAVQVKRIADVSAGSAGTATSVTLAKRDPGSAASRLQAYRNFTVEPTTYETEPLYCVELNSRAGVHDLWLPDDALVATQDMMLGILMAPRAAEARQVTVLAHVMEY